MTGLWYIEFQEIMSSARLASIESCIAFCIQPGCLSARSRVSQVVEKTLARLMLDWSTSYRGRPDLECRISLYREREQDPKLLLERKVRIAVKRSYVLHLVYLVKEELRVRESTGGPRGQEGGKWLVGKMNEEEQECINAIVERSTSA